MRIDIEFDEGLRVNAKFGEFTVKSDQAKSSGGDGSSPEPFDYFLSSMALCAGYYIRSFCKTREIDMTGIKIYQDDSKDPENKFQRSISLTIELPEGFPDKYKRSIEMAAKGCSVKKVIEQGPEFEIVLK